MKITNISCTQFAGVRDRNISFTDGINVIYGKNESGKSTLVNLISRTLFQNARLDRRSDKVFYDLYFPGTKKGSTVKGDFADGKITLTTEQGEYILAKEWGADSRCTLSTPDGVIRDQRKIDEILKDVLLYGEGVYSDILFSSQRNTDVSLQTILDASKKSDAKQEITEVITQAFAETDGISVDAIEQAIIAKIDEIAGKHWDFDREAPVRKTGRWSTGLGEILKAYYALEDAKAVLCEISRLEEDAVHAAEDYTAKDSEMQKAEETYIRFNKFANRLAVRSERKKAIDRMEKEISKIAEILTEWPKTAERLERARALQAEKTDRTVLEKYEAAKKISEKIAALDAGAANMACPANTEIALVKSAQHKIISLENKLCGMNITAAITMLNGNQVTITSLRTGEAVDLSGGDAAITEAVKITLPGVMEMQLSPANVDVAWVEAQMEEQKNTLAEIYEKYKASSLEELESLVKNVADSKAELENANTRLDWLLGTTSFEALETAAIAITDAIRCTDEINGDIFALCGKDDISAFITRKETVIDGYIAEYGSINDLKARASALDVELRKTKDSVSVSEDIPSEYLNVSNPDDYLETLKKDLEMKRTHRESALTAKTAAISKLESCKETILGDPSEEVEKAERIFAEQKSLLNHWRHIDTAFKTQKEKMQGNPMQDIADRFAQYLNIISVGKVESEFPEADKLKMNIYSDNRLLDYGKLSEGTKDTVSLAFRLAVLDHLFPAGGGIIVFDDPFTDMDQERTAQACELVKNCARRHQVIFLTCKEEYADMLDGNRIRV